MTIPGYHDHQCSLNSHECELIQRLASAAQSDARPTSDQEAAGSIPAGSSDILS